MWVLDPTESPSLTLVTCYPFYFIGSAPKRFIVRAARRRNHDSAINPEVKEAVMRVCKRLALVAGAILGFGVGAVTAHQAPTTTTNTQVRQFEIVSVDGNKVVVKGDEGYWEITVADDFRLSVDGQPVGVRDLKPGMKGSATITTTTTSTPGHGHAGPRRCRDAEDRQLDHRAHRRRDQDVLGGGRRDSVACGSCATVQPLAFTDLNVGDNLTATIVTTHPPKIMTQQQVAASMASAPAAAPPPEAPRGWRRQRRSRHRRLRAAPPPRPKRLAAAQDGQPVAVDRAGGGRLHAARAHAHHVAATALGVSGSSM